MRWARGTSAVALAGLVAAGCGGSSKDYVAAAITAGMAVAAAAVNRAATDECWGLCGHGERCDASSGVCVAAPPEGVALAPGPVAAVDCDPDLDPECEPIDAPLPGGQASASAEAASPVAPLAAESDVDSTFTDPCRGLCLSGEVCITKDGVADCVLASPAP